MDERNAPQSRSSVETAGWRPEAFVHCTHRLGETMEPDPSESRAVIAGRQQEFTFLVASLPG